MMFAIDFVPDKKKRDLVGMKIIHVLDLDSTLLCYNFGLAVHGKLITCLKSTAERKRP